MEKFSKGLIYIIILFFVFTVIGCDQQNNRFVFVETKDGLSVYLDGRSGRLIYIDETNRIIDYVSLTPSSDVISSIESNKQQALRITSRGSRDIPGMEFTVRLSTRFYSNRLLYTLELEPYNDRATRFANTISIELLDSSSFVIGTINRSTNWVRSVDNSGNPTGLSTQGSIPITLRNYLEINRWGPLWQADFR